MKNALVLPWVLLLLLASCSATIVDEAKADPGPSGSAGGDDDRTGELQELLTGPE